MAEFTKIATKADIPADSGKVIEVSGKTLAVFNVSGGYRVVDNTCLHWGGLLGEGILDGSEVTCPWHGWVYDVKTGVSVNNPTAKVKAYEVKLEGEDILASLQ